MWLRVNFAFPASINRCRAHAKQKQDVFCNITTVYSVLIHRVMMPEILNQSYLGFMHRVFRPRHMYPTLWCIQVPQALDFAGTICFYHSSCTTHLTHRGKNKLYSLHCSICLPARNGSQASTPAQTCAHHIEFCASILLANIDGASKNYAASCKRSLLKSRPD
jgi:hypothetical protein